MSKKSLKGKIVFYLSLSLLVLGSLYTYGWYFSANKLEMALIDHIKTLEEKGYRVTYGSIHIKGFPFTLNLDIKDVTLEAPDPISTSLNIMGTLHVYASFMTPTKITFKAHNGITLKTTLLDQNTKVVLKAKTLIAHMPLPTPLEKFDITLSSIALNAFDIKAEKLIFGLQLKGNEHSRHVCFFDLKHVDMGGKTLGHLPPVIKNLKGKFSLKHTIKIDEPLPQALEKWYKMNGVADISSLSLTWGKLKIDTNGTLSLDENLQPLAAFSAEIYGLDAFLKTLTDLNIISKNAYPFLKLSLGFLKKQKKTMEQKTPDVYHKLSLTLQDNEVIIGSIPVFKFPVINWDQPRD